MSSQLRQTPVCIRPVLEPLIRSSAFPLVPRSAALNAGVSGPQRKSGQVSGDKMRILRFRESFCFMFRGLSGASVALGISTTLFMCSNVRCFGPVSGRVYGWDPICAFCEIVSKGVLWSKSRISPRTPPLLFYIGSVVPSLLSLSPSGPPPAAGTLHRPRHPPPYIWPYGPSFDPVFSKLIFRNFPKTECVLAHMEKYVLS